MNPASMKAWFDSLVTLWSTQGPTDLNRAS
jgi:hypothetical protein